MTRSTGRDSTLSSSLPPAWLPALASGSGAAARRPGLGAGGLEDRVGLAPAVPPRTWSRGGKQWAVLYASQLALVHERGTGYVEVWG